MGTKRELAQNVAEVIGTCRPGPILDVFSGMCSVGETVAPARQVWTNDVQVFAYEVAQALFTSQEHPLGSQAVADRLFDRFSVAYNQLSSRYETALRAEEELLAASSFEEFEGRRMLVKQALKDCQTQSLVGSFCLFTGQYSDTFVGVRQAAEIDSLIASLADEDISADCRRWILIALGRSMLRVANSTGHFAQYLDPKIGNYRTFQRQRKRRVWEEMLSSIEDFTPVGDPAWRRANRTFNKDTLRLLPELILSGQSPSVVYADPPYTNDQYSRFYHLLETLILYDYPEMTGKGLYRPGRFSTEFSLKARSAAAMEALVRHSARLGADLVLSYPSNGLVHSAGVSPVDILRSHYREVDICHAIGHDHSTFGASKGTAKASVVEMIYRARL